MKQAKHKKPFRFHSPALGWWIVTIVVVMIMLRLSVWQYERYQTKLRWQEAYSQAHLDLPSWSSMPDGSWYYAALKVAGHYTNRQWLLDNKTHQGRIGYHVLNLFIPEGDSRAILVDRGWVAATASRAVLPDVGEPKQQQQTLTGWLKPIHKPWQKIVAAASSQVIEYVDREQLEQATGHKLYPFLLWLAPKAPQGFVRQWRLGGIPAHRHLGYCVQWILLAITLCIVFIAVNCRRNVDRR